VANLARCLSTQGRVPALADFTAVDRLSSSEVATLFAVTPATVRKWLRCYLAGGAASLADASSRPRRSPRAIDPAKALLIVESRQRSQLQA
jgi:transposase-like protein